MTHCYIHVRVHARASLAPAPCPVPRVLTLLPTACPQFYTSLTSLRGSGAEGRPRSLAHGRLSSLLRQEVAFHRGVMVGLDGQGQLRQSTIVWASMPLGIVP